MRMWRGAVLGVMLLVGTAIPSAAQNGFSDGQWIVNVDIAPGTYRLLSAPSDCYWARLAGLSGGPQDIIAYANTNAREVVTIAPTDRAFESRHCGLWSPTLSRITSDMNGDFGDGTYLVGVDITPGTWRTTGASGCYWQRTSNLGGGIDGVIENGLAVGTTNVMILPSDVGFRTVGCGSWTKVG